MGLQDASLYGKVLALFIGLLMQKFFKMMFPLQLIIYMPYLQVAYPANASSFFSAIEIAVNYKAVKIEDFLP